jgi:hypothetical protein
MAPPQERSLDQMEPTSEPENNRQSRGLARFWPVHGMTAPAPRESEEDPGRPQDAAAAHTSDQPAGAAGPTGEHPQVSDQQSQPHDDQQDPDEQSPNPFAPRPHPALTSETQMVALGSRRPADALLGGNGARWTNQGGFPPVETNGHRNGDAGPRHGGAPIANGQAPVGNGSLPGSRSPFAPSGSDPSPVPPFGPSGDDGGRSAFIPTEEPPARSGFGDDAAPGQRPPFGSADNDGPQPPRPPFGSADNDGPQAPRSPFAPAEDDSPSPRYAPSPFAPQAAGSTPVSSANAGQQAPPSVAPSSPAAPTQPAARPAAAGSAQVPVPMPGRPVSTPPATAPAPVAPVQNAEPAAPTRLEPTGWATAGPRAGASGSAAVPVSAPSGRRSRDAEAGDEQAGPAPRRSTSLDDAHAAGRRTARAETGDAPLRPGDVNDISITFWTESASEQFRADWHEVKAQFVDDPVAALTRAHDLLTEAVHELTESMLAERDELDPLRGAAKPDTESMRMAMRGYREFLDRILAL